MSETDRGAPERRRRLSGAIGGPSWGAFAVGLLFGVTIWQFVVPQDSGAMGAGYLPLMVLAAFAVTLVFGPSPWVAPLGLTVSQGALAVWRPPGDGDGLYLLWFPLLFVLWFVLMLPAWAAIALRRRRASSNKGT